MKANLKINEWKQNEIESTMEYIKNLVKVINEIKTNNPKDYYMVERYRIISETFKGLARCYELGNIEYVNKKVTEMIEGHLEKLQNKVIAKIGDIQMIEQIGNNGLDYRFTGTKGSCQTKVVIAGGWNIQIRHMRWTLSKININNSEES